MLNETQNKNAEHLNESDYYPHKDSDYDAVKKSHKLFSFNQNMPAEEIESVLTLKLEQLASLANVGAGGHIAEMRNFYVNGFFGIMEDLANEARFLLKQLPIAK